MSLLAASTWTAIGTTAAVLGTAGSLASVGYSLAGGNQASLPNLASSSRDVSNSKFKLLPKQRQLAALAATGGVGDIMVDNQLKHVDFRGRGTADIQGAEARQTAQGALDRSKKYDSQFIAEALKQEALANPESVAARQRENDLIQQQISGSPNNPVSDLLNSQVESQVKAGKGLDEFDQDVLNRSASQALSERGGGDRQRTDFAEPLTTGFAGTQRQMAGNQKAISFLTSGSSPEDIAYRKEQQNLANLSAQINGATPVSEFKSLSGAQSQVTPTVSGPPLPTASNSLGLAANSAATNYAQRTNQTDSWMAGLSGIINASGAIGNIAQRN